jgi:hypothetical protein
MTSHGSRAHRSDALSRIEEPAPGHLYWPDLDVDLGLETIRHPERFPLKSRVP